MIKPQALASLALVSLLAGCGPAGKIAGKVVVEGGTAGKVLVRVLGPSSKAVLTSDSGDFTAEGLADGAYQVVAEVPNTEVTEQRATVNVANGTADGTPTLTFKAMAAQIAGKVVFADMSDSSGLTVTLSGTDSRGTQTDSSGAFTFTGLKAGAYLISAEVPGSREGRQSISVLAPSAATLPDLVFTLVGTLTGNVKAGTTNAPNATVNIPGTELFALTDPNGDFIIRNVPTGMRTVQARLNSAVSTQTVAVVKGDNTPLAFTLATALTGTVEGSVGFHGNTVDTGITVSAAGTAFTAMVASNGDYRLTLPPGAWEIVADARNYPRKSMGVHFVSPGATTRVPTAKMTLFKRLAFDQLVTGAALGPGRVCEGDYVLSNVILDTAIVPELHLLETNLLNRRHIASGPYSLASLSPRCRWVAFVIGSFTILHNVSTGEQRFLAGASTYAEFSSDESVFFYQVGTTFHRYNLTSAVDDTFAANVRVPVSRDRHLVAPAGAPQNYQLVTPTGATAAFSNTFAAVAHGGAAYALTDCTVIIPITCTLRTLGVTGTTVSTYATSSLPQASVIDGNNSSGEYFHFRNGTASILVRTSNGVGINMPASTQIIRYNPLGTRMAYVAPGAAQALREEALPGSGSVAPAATSATVFQSDFSYVSETRLIAFDQGTPRRIDIKTGTAAIDTDVTTNANGQAAIIGSVATWGKASTSRRQALLGDGPDLLIDVPATQLFNLGSTSPFSVTPGAAYVVPKYGQVSTDQNTTFVIDAMKNNEVRRLNGSYVLAGQTANVFTQFRAVTGEVGFLVPAYDQFLSFAEPSLRFSGFATFQLQPTVGVVSFGSDAAAPRDLLIHRLLPQP